ncbi:SIMPL domain-containing protein [Alteromonas pelagimontana]|uniref:SIMPL domain-containing protein n=1 Tax=Alteromonas pelagimontana TaxID=1858656 RepID=A0A6M4MHC2_9ALTE|nr:SIMPL domain-containing protein [Alteromonas pelagimontana]QJR82601.1 SIMPL domain-containing protein [Alteromonas pelagimontana]
MLPVITRTAFIVVACIISAAAFAENVTKPAINVVGKGIVAVVPDAFSVTFIVEEKGPKVAELNKKIQLKVRNLTTFLLESGIAENQIQSMQIQLNPWYESAPEGRKEAGFVLMREVRVTHNNIDNYDAIIDGALSSGVDRVQQFEFIASKQDNAYQQALINAVKDAKSRATLLAKELDVELGSVIAVHENGSSYTMPMMRASAMREDFASAMPGQQMIEASLNVSFAISTQD